MRLRTAIPILLVVLACGLLAGPSAMATELTVAQELQTRLGEEHYTGEYDKVPPMREAIMTEDGRVRLVIQLEEPPLANYKGGVGSFRATSPRATGARKLDVGAADAVAYRGFLRERQSQFERELRKVAPELRVGHRYQVVFNGLSVAVDPSRVGAISRMRGVKKVYPSKRYYQVMDASLPLINAPSFWSIIEGGRDSAGDGIKVAIVDGGIRPEHPMFDGTDFMYPEGYPLADDYCGLVDPMFCNPKLIVARHFNDDQGTLHPDEVDSPLGINGHGTHVAGSAVGNYVEGADQGDGVLENVSGVAPAAWLMVCKGLWWNGTTGSGGTGDLIACVDSMVADGADVINNSWGGGGGEDPRSDAFGEVFESAEAAGVVAVAAAGNAGPGARTIGCPGCQPSVLTVANSTHGRIHALSVDVDFPPSVQGTLPLSGLGCLEGTGVPFTGTVGPDPIAYAGDIDAANFEGCNPFPASSMDGDIALISRGSCTFATKVANAEAAGAVAVMVYNNLPGTPIVMGGLNFGETISSCMLSNDDGINVRDHVQANPGAPGTINFPASRVVNENWEDFISSSSSRGPNGWDDILKPEIAAPGTNIFSAWSPDYPPSPGEDYTIISGTSMASPHVAGAAALVMQQNPDWLPWQVKSALTSTTVQDLVKQDGVTPADPFDFGAGRLDLGKAKDAALTFDQVSIADGSCVIECYFGRMLQNETEMAGTWQAWVEMDGGGMEPLAIVSGPQIEVFPSEVTLDPGESAFFEVGVDTSLADQGEWYFARIRWVYTGAPLGVEVPDAVMPMAIFAAASTNPAFLTKMVDKEVAQPTEILSYQIDLTNLTITEPITLQDYIPENSSFIPGSEWSTEPGFSYDAGSNSLNWTGTLDPLTMEIVPGTSPAGGYLPLSDFFGPLPCSSVCDDTSITLSGFGFPYLGTSYSSVVMSSNGFFVVGDNADGATTPSNQMLPDPGAPNNVVAPFWTDIDMDGTDPADDGAGIWYAGILTDGVNNFLILEWEEVELWNVPGPTYTFQVWITLETGEIDLVYAAIPSVPGGLTVGAEDSSGTAGTSYYYDGTGTAPEVGTDLTVIAEGSVASFYFQTEAGWEIGLPIVNVAEAYTGINGEQVNGMGEMAAAITQVVEPEVGLFLEGECPGRISVYGYGATPGGYVRVFKGDWPGSSPLPATRVCSGTELELEAARPFPPNVRADFEGFFSFSRRLFPWQCRGRLQAVDMRSCTVTNSVPLGFDNGPVRPEGTARSEK